MTKGMIGTVLCLLMLPAAAPGAEGQIWKVVDENGNVIYTDQAPSDGSEPMELPGLSIIASDIEVPKPSDRDAKTTDKQGSAALSPRELRRKFSDFRITQPQPEETFWGTANKVVVAWGSSQPIPPEMNVTLYVDGQPQKVPVSGGVSLTLDRGEHRVYAELRDARNRRIVTTEPVTFFVKQHSVNFGRPGPSSAPGA